MNEECTGEKVREVLVEPMHKGMVTFRGLHLDRGEDIDVIVILVPIEVGREFLIAA